MNETPQRQWGGALSSFPLATSGPTSSGGGASAVLVAELALTQGQFEHLETAPQIMVPGVPGMIIVPLGINFGGNITTAYLNQPTVQLVAATALGAGYCPNFLLPTNAINVFFSSIGRQGIGLSSLSSTMPVGADLLVQYAAGGDLFGGGAVTDALVAVPYYLITG